MKLTSPNNEKYLQNYWDLQLERIKGENMILTEQINNISKKLIELTSENEAIKGEFKKMLQSNVNQVSNPIINNNNPNNSESVCI